jgi:hypothetical protein
LFTASRLQAGEAYELKNTDEGRDTIGYRYDGNGNGNSFPRQLMQQAQRSHHNDSAVLDILHLTLFFSQQRNTSLRLAPFPCQFRPVNEPLLAPRATDTLDIDIEGSHVQSIYPATFITDI